MSGLGNAESRVENRRREKQSSQGGITEGRTEAGGTTVREITERQKEIYEFIRSVIASRGIPPSIREIGGRFGIRSTNGVNKHLAALERSGHITRERGTSRGIAVPSRATTLATVPLLGRVAAGIPLLSPENREGECSIDQSLFGIRSAQHVFALRVAGDSMIEAHILDGDTVLVREQHTAGNGDIVVAMVDGEVTVKRFFVERDRVRLQPENRTMAPRFIDRGDLRLVGRVVGVMRRI
jgi:repressor LexA